MLRKLHLPSFAVGLLLLALVGSACVIPPSDAQTPPDITGVITNIHVAPASPSSQVGDPSRPVSSDDESTVNRQTAAPEQQAPGMGKTGTILVEGAADAESKVDKAVVTVTAETRLYEQRGADRRPLTFDALKVGMRVNVWFTGPIRESYPVQATASTVEVLGGDSGGPTVIPTAQPGSTPAAAPTAPVSDVRPKFTGRSLQH